MKRSEEELVEMSKRMRLCALNMAYSAGKNGAHLGGGLSAIEIFAVLYGAIARVDSQNPLWEDRDRILIGKAHGVLAYYTALYEAGFLTKEDIEGFEVNGSTMIGHPVKNLQKGIEYAGGSLGMALSVGAGFALSARNNSSHRKVYVVLGDGECQEGAIWETLIFATKYNLDNLVIIVDQNGMQSDGTTLEVAGFNDVTAKMRAFGCDVEEVDGHNISELLRAFQKVSIKKPKVIVAKTIKGKGVSFIEDDYRWHHSQLSKEQYEQAVREVQKGLLCRK